MSGGEVTATVVATAPAKVNLSLGVGPVRPDGFHALATVYQAIGIHDRVTVTDADDLTVAVSAHPASTPRPSVAGVPVDSTNIALRAAALLAAHHGAERGAHVHIEKSIPVAGGLAGGSADAAATLLACDHLWGLRTPRPELLELAAVLGSDVPFALVGGSAIGSGRGEVVTPLMTSGEYWWVLLESAEGLSTPAVYREYDVMQHGTPLDEPEIPDAILEALRSHDVQRLGQALTNDLQAAAVRLRPGLEQAIDEGLEDPLVHGALVSGSGPSCLFLCASRPDAVRLGGQLTSAGRGPVSVAPGPVPGARVVGRSGGSSWR